MVSGEGRHQAMVLDVPQQDEHSRDEGEEIADRHAGPYTVQPHELREDKQAGQQVDELARERHEDTDLGLADALEEIADDHLGSDEREDGYADAQAMGRHADERFVRSEYRSDGMGGTAHR